MTYVFSLMIYEAIYPKAAIKAGSVDDSLSKMINPERDEKGKIHDKNNQEWVGKKIDQYRNAYIKMENGYI